MHRIDSDNNVVGAKPAIEAAINAPGYFATTPGASPGTKVTGGFLNTVQEEIAGVIEGASIPLDRTNDHQLLAAIQALVAGVMPTGFRGATTLPTTPAGWVRANGLTIGNVGSNATERANVDTLALFTQYWGQRPDLQLYNSAAGAIARGGSAAADWAANCAIAVPDYRDRTGIGMGTMGNAAANRITNGVSALDTSVIGHTGGSEGTTLLIGNLPSAGAYDWLHGNDTPSTGGGNVHGGDRSGAELGADTPFSRLQPVITELKIIKL